MEKKPSEIITEFLSFLECMSMNLLMRMLGRRTAGRRRFSTIWSSRQTKTKGIRSLPASSGAAV